MSSKEALLASLRRKEKNRRLHCYVVSGSLQLGGLVVSHESNAVGRKSKYQHRIACCYPEHQEIFQPLRKRRKPESTQFIPQTKLVDFA